MLVADIRPLSSPMTNASADIITLTLPIEQFTFHWLTILWLQMELNIRRTTHNSSKKRSDKYKILPQEIPDLIHAKPKRYSTRNFMINVNDQILDDAAQKG
ncbi:hypothetical protein C8J56DRAFT_1042354 [Mycena floridula]|nr:hypothetical protein C8J56DRAFT_1042354 [Mycena floridula]